MKYLAITLFVAISHFFIDVRGMKYALGSFEYVSSWGSFIFGKKTFLEYEIDSFLKTVPLSHGTTKEEFKNIISKQAKEHFKTKLVSNYLYFAYLVIKSSDQDFENKLSKQVDIFIDNVKGFQPSTQSEKLKKLIPEKDCDITL